MTDDVRIHEPTNFPDARGLSFGFGPLVAALVGSPQDLHVATIRPRCVRGNHFHARRREVVIVLFSDRWQLAWDRGEGGVVQTRSFEGSGAVAVEVPPNCSHAFYNAGAADLVIASLTDGAYDPGSNETSRRVVHDGHAVVPRRSNP